MATRTEVYNLTKEELKDKILEIYEESKLEVDTYMLVLIIKRRLLQYYKIEASQEETEKIVKELISEGKIKTVKKPKN
uniref:Uncharacterized protein n=1 Tax=candidate division CPR3 bacterium TaxID=2268181 RepID=A0A7C4R2V1_UNCC3